jgi:glycerate kinase
MNILIAPNAFKNALAADEAAFAIQEGFMQSELDCTCESFPIGDGGDGTGELIQKKCGGNIFEVHAHDALGRKIKSAFGLIDDGNTAVIEMANASGLRLLKPEELNPLVALSFGTGEQMKAALDKGVKKIILGMGGSATVDGGCGILKALGIRFLNAEKNELTNLPGALIDLDSIDFSGADERIFKCEVVVLCDVDNLLLGANGAAAIFGPQKGASPEAVKKLDAGLMRLSQVVKQQTSKEISTVKYGGTAGGAAAGLFGMINAKLVNGINYFLDLTGFDTALAKADLVITGEGSIDEQTLHGKGPFGVAQRAKLHGKPVVALAGKIQKTAKEKLSAYFDALVLIDEQHSNLQTALKNTAANLKAKACEIGNLLTTIGADKTPESYRNKFKRIFPFM